MSGGHDDHDPPADGVPTGDQVRRAREARDLSRRELSDQVGCSESTVKLIEAFGAEPVSLRSRFTPGLLRLLELDTAATEQPTREGLLTPEIVERALRQADDVAVVAEMSRRLARAKGTRHDHGNVSAFGIRGMPESDDTGDGTGAPSA